MNDWCTSFRNLDTKILCEPLHVLKTYSACDYIVSFRFSNMYTFSLPLQMVHGQCFLNIQLHQYENMYSAVFRSERNDDPFCCCEQGGGHCQSKLVDISTKTCNDDFCDTFFVATLSDSHNFETWPRMWMSDVFHGSSTRTDVNYTFHFFLSKVPIESVCVHMRSYALYCQSITELSIISKLMMYAYYIYVANLLKTLSYAFKHYSYCSHRNNPVSMTVYSFVGVV